ncbi:hypothetical protein TBR22_A47660 [Luteitalea sp. TBR-22]|nr:hypothetical protein TBR22_A47660 [Luteitalea sp. TBR-22]
MLLWATASACLTLALVHLRIWFGERDRLSHLGFAIVAVGVAGFALSELRMMHAATADRFGMALRLVHVPIFVMVVGIILFVSDLFRTARPWLAHVAWVSNLATLVVLGSSPYGDYERIDAIERVRFLGADAALVTGPTSPWHWVGQAGFAMLTLFVLDAARPLWRSGDARLRRRALLIGGTLTTFVVFAAGEAALNFGGVMRNPLMSAPFFLPVLMAMGFELSDDVLRASRLTRALQDSEASLRQSEARMRDVASEAQRLSGRLIHAQEEERSRIARELHDDLSQRLGVMSLQLELLRRSSDEATRDEQVARLATDIRGIATEVHTLSHRLHPAKLDQLGLATAARAWCRDIGAEGGRLIEVSTTGVPAEVAPDTALCLYRILQETTRNATRHSGATSVDVVLSQQAGQLCLVVRDDGHGFDVGQAQRAGGLGLVSMRERVRSLGGTLAIHSAPGEGTRVEARVPLALRHDDADGSPEVATHAST